MSITELRHHNSCGFHPYTWDALSCPRLGSGFHNTNGSLSRYPRVQSQSYQASNNLKRSICSNQTIYIYIFLSMYMHITMNTIYTWSCSPLTEAWLCGFSNPRQYISHIANLRHGLSIHVLTQSNILPMLQYSPKGIALWFSSLRRHCSHVTPLTRALKYCISTQHITRVSNDMLLHISRSFSP